MKDEIYASKQYRTDKVSRRSDPEGPRGSNPLSSFLLYPITRQFSTRPVALAVAEWQQAIWVTNYVPAYHPFFEETRDQIRNYLS